MADAYDTAHACLDFEVSDAGPGLDADGANYLSESELGTDPCQGDTDGDGRVDDEELGQGLGNYSGNPLTPDFNDVTGDGVVDASDISYSTSQFGDWCP